MAAHKRSFGFKVAKLLFDTACLLIFVFVVGQIVTGGNLIPELQKTYVNWKAQSEKPVEQGQSVEQEILKQADEPGAGSVENGKIGNSQKLREQVIGEFSKWDNPRKLCVFAILGLFVLFIIIIFKNIIRNIISNYERKSDATTRSLEPRTEVSGPSFGVKVVQSLLGTVLLIFVVSNAQWKEKSKEPVGQQKIIAEKMVTEHTDGLAPPSKNNSSLFTFLASFFILNEQNIVYVIIGGFVTLCLAVVFELISGKCLWPIKKTEE